MDLGDLVDHARLRVLAAAIGAPAEHAAARVHYPKRLDGLAVLGTRHLEHTDRRYPSEQARCDIAGFSGQNGGYR